MPRFSLPGAHHWRDITGPPASSARLAPAPARAPSLPALALPGQTRLPVPAPSPPYSPCHPRSVPPHEPAHPARSRPTALLTPLDPRPSPSNLLDLCPRHSIPATEPSSRRSIPGTEPRHLARPPPDPPPPRSAVTTDAAHPPVPPGLPQRVRPLVRFPLRSNRPRPPASRGSDAAAARRGRVAVVVAGVVRFAMAEVKVKPEVPDSVDIENRCGAGGAGRASRWEAERPCAF